MHKAVVSNSIAFLCSKSKIYACRKSGADVFSLICSLINHQLRQPRYARNSEERRRWVERDHTTPSQLRRLPTRCRSPGAEDVECVVLP
jgi:hypothetical protein